MINATRVGTPIRERVRPRVAAPRVPWEHVGLGVILVLAAALNCWRLSRLGFANPYYAATVRSMLSNWHAFLFASFDPAGFVSVDKPPFGFWLQAAAAKAFGFRGWSLLLPQALAGVLAVPLLFHLVRRPFGPVAALAAALALSLSPISVVTNRNNTIDSLLVLTVLCAAWAMTKATATGRLRWLLASMALVGVGFNIKMLEAYLVVPALAAVYLLGAKYGWGKRLGHLAVGIVVLLAVSLSWAAVDLTPAGERPWVGSTADNAELSLAIGYNGLQRLLGHTNSAPTSSAAPDCTASTSSAASSAPSATTPSTGGSDTTGTAQTAAPAATGGDFQQPSGNGGAPGGGGNGGPGGTGENGAKGVFRLINQQLGGQIGWLVPFAAVGLVAGGGSLFARPLRQRWLASDQAATIDRTAGRRRSRARRFLARIRQCVRGPLNEQQQSATLWGVWFLTMAGFFSVAGFFHRYYLSMLAPAVAALVGIGIAVLWRAYRHRRPVGWILPVAVLGTAAVQAKILHDYPTYAYWMTPAILGVGFAAAASLVLARLRPFSLLRRRLAMAAATAGLLILLLAPAVWSGISVINGNSGGTPSAGPAQQAQGFPGGAPRNTGDPSGAANGNAPNGDDGGMGGSTNSALVAYMEANRGSATYLLAVPSSMSADSIIIATGEPVMAMGGFSGSDPILTAQRVAHLVQDGTVRFFLLGGGFGRAGGQSATGWVTSSCAAVPSSAYQSATGTPTTGGVGGSQTLYDCSNVATTKG